MTFLTCVRILPRASYTSRPSFLVQKCRSFLLLNEVFRKKPPAEDSMITKLVPFNGFIPPAKCIINLQHNATTTTVRKQATLLSAMKLHIKPGKILSPSQPSVADNEYPRYKISCVTTEQLQTHVLERRGKGAWKSRAFKLSPSTPPHRFIELTAAMWRLLKERQSVEVQVTILDARIWGESYPLAEMFQENLHLRPDVLLKAMPPNCGITVDPQTDHKIVVWIMNPPYIDKNGKAYPPNKATKQLNERKAKAMEKEITPDQPLIPVVQTIYTSTPERTPLQLKGNGKDWKKIKNAADWGPLAEAVRQAKNHRKELVGVMKERYRLRELGVPPESLPQRAPQDE